MNTQTVDLRNNGVNVRIGNEILTTIDIPSDYIPKDFAAVLGSHYLLTGDKLQEGMLVLLEDRLLRGRLPKEGEEISDYDRQKLDEISRWAVVTDLRVAPNAPDSRLVSFTAIYADGTMRNRTYNVSYKWVVLRDFTGTFASDVEGILDATEEIIDYLRAKRAALQAQ